MVLLLTSFVAGVLSVLAPCVIVLIPVLLARSSTGDRVRNPACIIGGLGVSVMLFSVLLKASTLLIAIPTRTWQVISGIIVILFGITYMFPVAWDKVAILLSLQQKAGKASGKALQRQGAIGDIILGASLGPVFSACSPTYALIVATILPATPVQGVLYLLSFVVGLSAILTLIAIAGSGFIRKLGWGINPHGWFKQSLGIAFLVAGLLIATGVDKQALGYVVEHGWFDWQVNLESRLQP